MRTRAYIYVVICSLSLQDGVLVPCSIFRYCSAFIRSFSVNPLSLTPTDVSEYEHDPLADATYIRANFSYIPRTVKELSIKAGDVFHIHDEVGGACLVGGGLLGWADCLCFTELRRSCTSHVRVEHLHPI